MCNSMDRQGATVDTVVFTPERSTVLIVTEPQHMRRTDSAGAEHGEASCSHGRTVKVTDRQAAVTDGEAGGSQSLMDQPGRATATYESQSLKDKLGRATTMDE